MTKTTEYYPVAGAMRVNGTLYYMLKDHLGSANVITNASGATIGEARYYPYGETRLATGSMFTDKLFTGQREMTGLGIYHYGARFYSPKLGRFLSADTIIPNAANPQDFNRYSYVRNNPVRYIDPTGYTPVCGFSYSDPECNTLTPPTTTTPCIPPTLLPDPPRGEDGGGGGNGGSDDEIISDPDDGSDSCTFYTCIADCSDSTWGCGTDVGGTWEDPAVYLAGGLACLGTGLCMSLGSAALSSLEGSFWGVATSCISNVVCSLLTGMAGGAGAQETNQLVRQAQQQYPNKAGNIELHHIFPTYLGGNLNGEVVAIDAAYHQVITNAFRELWRYGQGAPTVEQAQRIMQQVYNRFPLP